MKKSVLIIFILFISLIVTGCTKEENGESVKDTYTFTYKGVNVTPGTEFKSKSIDEKSEYTELESCAFEGNDKVYKYKNVEITASAINGKDTVYSVYFLDDTAETTEGVKISDDKSLMIEKYGENYEHINNEYKYTKSNVVLSFIIENDTIVSIEYIYNNGDL